MLRKQLQVPTETTGEMNVRESEGKEKRAAKSKSTGDAKEKVEVRRWLVAADDAVIAECRGLVVEIEDIRRPNPKTGGM
jgi:hypothetical protein